MVTESARSRQSLRRRSAGAENGVHTREIEPEVVVYQCAAKPCQGSEHEAQRNGNQLDQRLVERKQVTTYTSDRPGS
jgi:hypothetical protein